MITRQEMFDRAWRGLKAQGWVQSMHFSGDYCVYLSDDGKRCAWGHVDPDATGKSGGDTVRDLATKGVGIAATLSTHDLDFAASLQGCHDQALDGAHMEERLRELAEQHGLTIPDEAP